MTFFFLNYCLRKKTAIFRFQQKNATVGQAKLVFGPISAKLPRAILILQWDSIVEVFAQKRNHQNCLLPRHTFLKVRHTFLKVRHTFLKARHTFLKARHTFLKASDL